MPQGGTSNTGLFEPAVISSWCYMRSGCKSSFRALKQMCFILISSQTQTQVGPYIQDLWTPTENEPFSECTQSWRVAVQANHPPRGDDGLPGERPFSLSISAALRCDFSSIQASKSKCKWVQLDSGSKKSLSAGLRTLITVIMRCILC